MSKKKNSHVKNKVAVKSVGKEYETVDELRKDYDKGLQGVSKEPEIDPLSAEGIDKAMAEAKEVIADAKDAVISDNVYLKAKIQAVMDTISETLTVEGISADDSLAAVYGRINGAFTRLKQARDLL